MIYHLSLLDNRWFLIEGVLPHWEFSLQSSISILRHYLRMLFRVALPKFFSYSGVKRPF